MTTHLIYIISLFIGLLPAKNSDCQEIFKSDNIIIGKWGNVDTGFAISTEFINKLYREDNNWSESGINSQKFYFVDSTITSEGSEFTIWATSSYTSRRLYLKNGGEESIETTEYKIFKFKNFLLRMKKKK